MNCHGKNRKHYPLILSLTFLMFGCLAVCAAEPLVLDKKTESRSDILAIGKQKQLLVDDYVIAEKSGVTRELGQATKLNNGKPVFEGHFYGTVLYDQGKFKLWYRGNPYGYAESTAGLNFRHVSKLVGLDPAHQNTTSIYIDPHETDPAHRYKACYSYLRPHAATLAYSADGIHWKPYNNGQPVTNRAADTYNQILWDEEAGVYRLFTRTDFQRPPDRLEVRGARDMINPDVKADPTNWKTVREWKFGKGVTDEVYRRQIYSLTDWIHEGVHFGLMSVYEFIPRPGAPYDSVSDLVKRHDHDIVNFYIGTTRGNAMWDLSWGYAEKPMIPRGPDRSFDKDMIFPASQIVTRNDTHWIYYSGYRARHGIADRGKYGIGVATIKRDRFIALQAKGNLPGNLTTKPFQLEGTSLQVNVNADCGRIRVEVLDRDSNPIPGFSGPSATWYESTDQLRLKPRWQSDLASLKGKVVRLRLTLQNARLFAFQIQ